MILFLCCHFKTKRKKWWTISLLYHDGSNELTLVPQFELWNHIFKPVLWIHDILVWIQIRIRGSMPLTYGSSFIIDCQDANKKLIFCSKVFLHITL
jgi:hypothetical protein